MEPYVNRNGLFPTPQTSDREEPLTDEQLTKYVAKYEAKGIMPSCAYQLRQAAVMNLLPTPNAGCYRNAGSTAEFWEHRKEMNRQMDICMWVYEQLKDNPAAKDGDFFRLNPLFTEEMMGFPLMWTTYPFLSENGEPKV